MDVLPFDLVVFDLETNGRPHPGMRIIELGAVRLAGADLREVDSFSELVLPEAHLGTTEKATSVHTLTQVDLEQRGRHIGSVLGEFAAWCLAPERPYVLASWGTHFDVGLLRRMHEEVVVVKYPHPGTAFCAKTAVWAHLLGRGDVVSRCGLGSALRHLGLQVEGERHRALDDARMAAACLRKVFGRAGFPEKTS